MSQPISDEENAFMQRMIAADWEGREEEKTEEKPAEVTTGKSKYPWEKWLDGEYHEIVRGVDFEMPAVRFQVQLYRKADDRDLVVKTERLDKDRLGFMFGRTHAALSVKWRLLEEGLAVGTGMGDEKEPQN